MLITSVKQHHKQQTTTTMYSKTKISKILLSVFLLFIIADISAQPSEEIISRNQYIEMWKDEAIRQQAIHKIPASITLAQGILESGNGNSDLAKYANNHFGIKCHNWDGETLYKDDDKKDECFRKYLTPHESFEDHSLFLTKRGRYSFLFDYKTTDYKAWAKGLKKAGYATNPKYPSLLIDLIERYDLDQYDTQRVLANGVESQSIATKVENRIVVPNATITMSAMVNVHAVVLTNNNVKYIQAKNGDTFYKIAKEFEMGLWQLYKYNDLTKKDILLAGDIIYLQPKRNKSKTVAFHIIKENESLKEISQLYGIKLKKLYKLNDLVFGLNPPAGMKLVLR